MNFILLKFSRNDQLFILALMRPKLNKNESTNLIFDSRSLEIRVRIFFKLNNASKPSKISFLAEIKMESLCTSKSKGKILSELSQQCAFNQMFFAKFKEIC
jgi:hypothetical protein